GQGAHGMVTPINETLKYPAWSEDGTSVLFTANDEDGAGDDVFQQPTAGGARDLIAGGTGDEIRALYSANGHVVLFHQNYGRWNLLSVAGDQATTLAANVRFPLRARPALTPDGKWVAYSLTDPQRSSSIVLSRVDGSATVEVPTSFTGCGEPAITVQGRR